MFTKRIIIFANGELPNLEKARTLLHEDDFIIAADGGTRHAFALGLTPSVIVGDLDSLPENFNPSTFNGEIILYPKDKNETDLELALQHALTFNPNEIVVVAALGGRLDQTLGNITLISNLQFETRKVKLDDGIEEIFFCRDICNINGSVGDIVSLIPWQNEVTGIITTNLKWTLQNEPLYYDKTRGMSNEMMNDTASIQIKSGLLLIVHRRND